MDALYRLLADMVVVVHLGFIGFVAVGSLLLCRWPRLLWPHLAALAWAAAIVTIGFTCPLTPLEKHFRVRADATPYAGGFVDHYLEDVVYPGRFTTLARLAVAVPIVVGYAVIVVRRRRRPRSVASL